MNCLSVCPKLSTCTPVKYNDRQRLNMRCRALIFSVLEKVLHIFCYMWFFLMSARFQGFIDICTCPPKPSSIIFPSIEILTSLKILHLLRQACHALQSHVSPISFVFELVKGLGVICSRFHFLPLFLRLFLISCFRAFWAFF